MELVASSDSHVSKIKDLKLNNIYRDCEGLGVVRETLKEKIRLPKGLVNGQKLKLKRYGHASDVF